MKILKQKVEMALDKAILQPTESNLVNYIRLQNQINQKAHYFSKTWQKVIWHHPELDYSLRHPTNQMGTHLYLDLLHKKEEKAIRSLAEKYGLFFFFSSDCPYCRTFAPIVKDFATRYGFSIVPITINGKPLPEFPNARLDNGASKRLGVNRYPSLFAVNPKLNRVIPLSYGVMSKEELSQRVYQLTQLQKQRQTDRDRMASRKEGERDFIHTEDSAL